jgi:formate dehydrogenase alpha subunit
MSPLKQCTITIDGKTIQAAEGANLLLVAHENGIDIPSLCFHKKLNPTGACRLCLVKMTDRPGLFTSCTMTVSDGLELIAFDEELESTRRDLLDLLLSEHNEAFDGSYEDEFRALVQRYHLEDVGQRKFVSIWQEVGYEKDTSSPVLDYDASKCVKCFRCIKACDEIQGKNVLSFANKGIKAYIVGGVGVWGDSECDGCGECVQLCPTGALVEKPLIDKVNLDEVEKRVQTTCTYCGVGCQMDLWVQDGKVVRVTGVDAFPNQGRLCVKGRFGYEFIHHPERLTTSLIRKKGKFVEATIDEALDVVAQRFSEIKQQYGGKAFAGFASAKCTSEENYLFQKFFRAYLGTNNIEHCTRFCHASTVSALMRSIGSGAAGGAIQEFENTSCILVTGSDPIETHPVTATYIKAAARKGIPVYVVDPRKTPLVKYATKWLKQNPGTDVAWLNGLAHVVIKEGKVDYSFIEQRCNDGMNAYAELESALEKYTPEYVSTITGIDAADIWELGRVIATAPSVFFVTGMGMSQSTHGTQNVTSLINLALITGNLGKYAAGIVPLRGQNNVQGASDVGCVSYAFPGYQASDDPAVLTTFAEAWGIDPTSMDSKKGLSAIEIMNHAYEGAIHAIYVMGENPMLSDPNLNHTLQSLKNVDFLVVQDIFLTETAALADVVLPASCFAEKEGTFTNTERRVLRVRKAVDPPEDAQLDWWYIQEIAQRMGFFMNYHDTSEVMEEIASVSPSYGGISHQRLEAGGIQWPCPTPEHPGTAIMFKDSFPIGKAVIFPVEFEPLDEQPDGIYPFMLNTGRTLYHYHTATMTRKTSTLNQYIPKAYLEINPTDARMLTVIDGEKVKLISRRGEIEVWLKETEFVSPGELFLPFHFNESPANILTDDKMDPISKIARFKQSACRIEKIS